LQRAFGRPKGLLGKLGGLIMARSNRTCAVWATELLGPQPHDRIVELGFGPGVAIELLAERAREGYVAGLDASAEMLAQARRRNARAIVNGRVELRQGSVDNIPFADASFDKALAINSLQVWPDALAGLREIRRVLKNRGQVAFAFTPHSGRSPDGLTDLLAEAGFAGPRLVTKDENFCAVATKP
jgi:ubiquinone/menaquinone biosynthesis C-methylase UbiE